jgi:hypothetical protein
MVQLVVMAAAAAVAAAVTAIAGAIAQGERDKAQEIRQKVIDQWGDDIAPKLDKAIAYQVGPTALASIQVDPTTRDTQMDSLRKLSSLYDSGGMSQGDEAALQLANEGAQQQSSSDYQSLQQNLAARGQTMNPALAAALASKSGGDVVAATARNRYQAQADARNKAYNALRDSATLAGNIHQQDYNEQAARASAQDHINQFNAGQLTAADNANAQREEARSQARIAIAQGRSNAYNALAGGHEDNARGISSTGAGIANSVSTLGAGMVDQLNKGGQAAPQAPAYGPTADYSGSNYNVPSYGGVGSYDPPPQGPPSNPDEWVNPFTSRVK